MLKDKGSSHRVCDNHPAQTDVREKELKGLFTAVFGGTLVFRRGRRFAFKLVVGLVIGLRRRWRHSSCLIRRRFWWRLLSSGHVD